VRRAINTSNLAQIAHSVYIDGIIALARNRARVRGRFAADELERNQLRRRSVGVLREFVRIFACAKWWIPGGVA